MPSFRTDTIAYVTLPPGRYALAAAVDARPRDPGNRALVTCAFSASGSADIAPVETSTRGSSAGLPDDGSSLSEPIVGFGSISLVGTVTLVDGRDIGVDCTSTPHDGTFDATLTATSVGSIENQLH